MPLPANTAVTETAVNQANASSYFFGFSNIFGGVDDQFVLDASTRDDGKLGPSTTLGADIGIGANGQIFLRGTTQTSAPGASSSVASGTIGPLTPMGWLLVGLAAFFILK